MSIVSFINKVLQVIGIQIKKYPPLDFRNRISLIKTHSINKIIDIGANSGIYGLEMRKLGFSGEIISFEPLSDAFRLLSKNSSSDNHWQILNCAVGDKDGETLINISKNSVSSSILEMLPLHFENAKNSVYINKETIKICKLDTVFDNYYQPGDKIFLKIDTQGYEKNVLEGAIKSIPKIKGMQLELSLVSLYNGSPQYMEMLDYINSLGFQLYSIENGFYEAKTGRLMQIDGIFFREDN
jgi:FkbM family methyltransferase